jgi:dTDP-4-dehydrorhamnose reductase
VRAFVTGAGGQLGRALVAQLGAALAGAATREELDVRDATAVREAVLAARPDVVFNAAADNRVDAAESDPEAALAVNARGAENVARAAAKAGALAVHVSTDYVFDGRKTSPYEVDDPPHPLGAYGRSKREGETLVLGLGAPALVVRTSGVFVARGSKAKGGSFVDRILSRARRGEPLRVVADQVFSPTYAPDLAEGLVALVERQAAPGLYHLSNAGACSWHEMAEAALREAGIDAPVAPITTAELGAAAPRPAYSVLSNARAVAAGVAPLRPWREALRAMMRPS